MSCKDQNESFVSVTTYNIKHTKKNYALHMKTAEVTGIISAFNRPVYIYLVQAEKKKTKKSHILNSEYLGEYTWS